MTKNSGKRKSETTTTPKRGKQKTKMTEGKVEVEVEVEGGRRSTRLQLQSKFPTFPPNSSPTLNPCAKVSSPASSKYPHLKHHTFSVSARRIKQVEKGSKPMPDSPPNQDQGLEGNSSINFSSDLEAMLNEHTAPSPSRPLKSTSKVYQRQQVKMTSTPRPAKTGNKLGECSNLPEDTVNAMLDNVLNHGNEDIRKTDSSPAAANFVGAPPVNVMVSNVSEERLQESADANPTFSYGLTEIGNMFRDDDLSDDEVESSGWITIAGKYSAKEALAPIVRSIIDKYGDIAANYSMETPKGRSVALENLAEFIQTFQSKKFVDLSENEVEKALQFVSDFGKQRLNVGWLEQKLKALLKARQTVKQSSMLKEKKDKLNEVIKEKKRFLEITKKELNVAVGEIERIKAITAEVKYFVDHPPLGDLF